MYFNGAAPPVEFRLPDGTASLATFTSKLNELFPDTVNKKVIKIEFREYSIDTDGRLKYNFVELKTHEDLTVMWRSFLRRLTKVPIDLDAKISRSVNDIIKMLKRLESYDNV